MAAQEVNDFLDDCEHQLQRITEEAEGDVEEALFTAERLLRYITLVEATIPFEGTEILCDSVLQVINALHNLLDQHFLAHNRGRPRVPIPESQLRSLLEYHYSLVDIGRILAVSPRTVRRRILEYGLEAEASYSDISDEDLDAFTQSFAIDNPDCGLKTYEGFLRSCGLKLQRARVRESMLRVDPIGVQRRLRRALHRRRYNVPAPNSLWHVDGHHKLIRWGIVVHAAIDGYSRLPVFLRASDNNRADTVLDCFLEAVEVFGLPSRVRCDKGGENVRISQFMLSHPARGPNRASCITGRSVHNQRVERFWRDLFSGCVSIFYFLFYGLEDSELLDRDDPVDLFCIHYVFLPRINHQLGIFREMYSHHRLRGCRNRSPYQLWISGIAFAMDQDAVINGVEDDMVRLTCMGKNVFTLPKHLPFIMFKKKMQQDWGGDFFVRFLLHHYRTFTALTGMDPCQMV